MPLITNYATLTQAIQDFTHRPDLAAFVDYFIQGATGLIQNDILAQNLGRPLQWMGAAFAPVAISASGTVPVPADWIAPKFLTVISMAGRQQALRFVEPGFLYESFPDRLPMGIPTHVAIDGESGASLLQFGPYPDNTYTVQGMYYQAIPLLTSGAPVNWLVTQAPMVFLHACLTFAAPFLTNEKMLAMWQALYQQQLKALILRDRAMSLAGGTLASRSV